MGIFKGNSSIPITSVNDGTSKTVQLNLTLINGDGASINLITDLVGSFSAVKVSDDRYYFLLDKGFGQGASIVITKSGCKDINHRLSLADGSEVAVPSSGAWELESEICIPNLTPIGINGLSLSRDGKPFHPLYLTAFDLPRRFDSGDIEGTTQFLEWAETVADGIRIFIYWNQDYKITPDQLDKFLTLATNYVYVEAVVFTGAFVNFGSDAVAQLQFYNSVLPIFLNYQDCVSIELVNEADQTSNKVAFDVSQITIPNGILFSRGSNGADATPVTPPGNVAGFHLARTADWYRKPHNAWEAANTIGVPVGNDEMNRPDLDSYNVAHFKQAGTASALVSAWTTSHSSTLENGIIPSGDELNCVLAVLDGARRVPAGVNTWQYTRNDLSGCPLLADNALRVYVMISSDNSIAYGVVLDAVGGIASNVRAIDGWKITSFEDCFYELSKV